MEFTRLSPGLMGEIIRLIYRIGFTEADLYHLNEVARIMLREGSNRRYLAGRMLYLARQVRADMDRANELLGLFGLQVEVSLQGVAITTLHPPASPEHGHTA